MGDFKGSKRSRDLQEFRQNIHWRYGFKQSCNTDIENYIKKKKNSPNGDFIDDKFLLLLT